VISVVGTSCNDVICSNPQYSHDNYYRNYDPGYFCDVNNMCVCDEGYKEDSNGQCFKGKIGATSLIMLQY